MAIRSPDNHAFVQSSASVRAWGGLDFSLQKTNCIARESAAPCGPLNCSVSHLFKNLTNFPPWLVGSNSRLFCTCSLTYSYVAASSPFLTLTWRQPVRFSKVLLVEDVSYWSKLLLSLIFFLTSLSLTTRIIHFRSLTVMPHRNFESP